MLFPNKNSEEYPPPPKKKKKTAGLNVFSRLGGFEADDRFSDKIPAFSTVVTFGKCFQDWTEKNGTGQKLKTEKSERQLHIVPFYR